MLLCVVWWARGVVGQNVMGVEVESGRGFSKSLTTGKEGGMRGEKWAAEVRGGSQRGEREAANAGGGATPATSELRAKRWNNFALSRISLVARVPSQARERALADPPSGWEVGNPQPVIDFHPKVAV